MFGPPLSGLRSKLSQSSSSTSPLPPGSILAQFQALSLSSTTSAATTSSTTTPTTFPPFAVDSSVFAFSNTSSLSSDDPVFDHLYVFEEVTSTMDKARELMLLPLSSPSSDQSKSEEIDDVRVDLDKVPIFAVLAEHQTKGRGTRGRNWFSSNNNMYLTLSIKLDALPIPWTLIPLRIGTLIYPHIKDMIVCSSDSSNSSSNSNNNSELNNPLNANVNLKWPNDVLINGRKVCGVLIEIDKNRMLIGIGCNVGSAPVVVHNAVPESSASSKSNDNSRPDANKDIGRPSGCLGDFNPKIHQYYASKSNVDIGNKSSSDSSSSDSSSSAVLIQSACSSTSKSSRPSGSPHHLLAKAIFHSVAGWTGAHAGGFKDITGRIITKRSQETEAPEALTSAFESVMDFAPQKLRPDNLSHYVKKPVAIAAETSTTTSSNSETTDTSKVVYDPIKETERTLDAPIITPRGINTDGSLRVTFEGSNNEVNLVADYIW